MVDFFKNKEMRNAGWIVGERLFEMLISFAVSILSARYLGPANHGLINYTASFVAFVSSIATLGMDGVVIQKMIAKPDAEGVYLGSAIGYRLVSAVLCSAGVIAVVSVLNNGDSVTVSLIVLQSIQLLFTSIHVLDSWFQRYLKSKYVSIAKMAACVVVAGYKIWLLISAKDIRWFAFSNSLSIIVVSVILFLSYRKEGTQPIRFSFGHGKELLKDSYHFILSGLMTAIYGQIDKIMLGEMISSVSVGLYSVASALCTMWLFVPTAIINSLRPGILSLKNQGKEEEYLYRLKKMYAIIILLCIGVSVAVFLFGGIAVRLLYGEAYSGAVESLKILIWSEVFSMIGTARGVWILAEKKNKYVKYYLGMGACVNMVLNWLFIPTFGANGASAATLITQIFTSLIAPMFFKETRIHTMIVLQSFGTVIRRKGKC